MRGLFVAGASILLLFAMLSCDAPSSITKNAENEVFLQNNSINNKTNISANSLRWIKPGSRTVRNNEVIYTCYIWQNSDKPKILVWQVLFPGKVTRSAGSETTRFIYKNKNVRGELIRYAGCTIPHTELAIELIRKSLDNNRSNKSEANNETDDGNLVLMSDCGDYECELEWDPSLQAYVCTAPPCGGGEDEENGDGPPPYGGGGGGNDPPGDGNGGDHDEQLPENIEPCETNNSLLNNVPFQDSMYQAWFASYGPDEDPHNQTDRVEKLIMVTAISSGYVFTEIIPDSASSCHMTPGSGLSSVPTNLVGFIHTHPYKDGDIITDPNCPKIQNGTYNYNGNVVSDGDEALVQFFKDHNQLPAVPMYVIDKDKIRVIQPSNPSQYAQTINRCGY